MEDPGGIRRHPLRQHDAVIVRAPAGPGAPDVQADALQDPDRLIKTEQPEIGDANPDWRCGGVVEGRLVVRPPEMSLMARPPPKGIRPIRAASTIFFPDMTPTQGT
jgi:hypothetical protein